MENTALITLGELIENTPDPTFIFPETSPFELKHSFAKQFTTLLGGVDSSETTSYVLNKIIPEAAKEGNNCLYIAPNYKMSILSQSVDSWPDSTEKNLHMITTEYGDLTYNFSPADLISVIVEKNISLVIIDSLNDFINNFFIRNSPRRVKVSKTFDIINLIHQKHPTAVLITHTTKQEKTTTPTAESINEHLIYCLSQVVLLLSNLGNRRRSITNIRNFIHTYSPTSHYTITEKNDNILWSLNNIK